MNQILRCDWLPERARRSYLARSGLPALSRKKNFPESLIINKSFIDQACSLISASFVFCVFMDLDSVSVHKLAKKELGQYPAILTSHLVNNAYILAGEVNQSSQALLTFFPFKTEQGLDSHFWIVTCRLHNSLEHFTTLLNVTTRPGVKVLQGFRC